MRAQLICKWLAGLCLAFGIQAAVIAQSYPAKTVRIIVPFPPGAGADTTVRLFTPKLTDALGQQFIVDNRAGAAGNIGAEAAARAAPDGYTFLVAPASLASSQSMYKNLTFDLARDFTPVAMLGSAPFVLAIHPSVPAKTVRELIAYAKSNPGKLNFASTGVGGVNHLAGELFKSMAGIDIVHVPYKGTSTAIPDLIGGQVSMMFTSTLSSLPHVKAGRLRAIAISSEKRSLAAPDLPTIAESGLPGYESATWFALVAPTGTSRDIINLINSTLARISLTPEIRDQLLAQGAEPQSPSPEQVGAYVRSEVVKWAKVVTISGAKAE